MANNSSTIKEIPFNAPFVTDFNAIFDSDISHCAADEAAWLGTDRIRVSSGNHQANAICMSLFSLFQLRQQGFGCGIN